MGTWSKENTDTFLVELRICVKTLKINALIPLKTYLPQDPAVILLGMYPKETLSYNRDTQSHSLLLYS